MKARTPHPNAKNGQLHRLIRPENHPAFVECLKIAEEFAGIAANRTQWRALLEHRFRSSMLQLALVQELPA